MWKLVIRRCHSYVADTIQSIIYARNSSLAASVISRTSKGRFNACDVNNVYETKLPRLKVILPIQGPPSFGVSLRSASDLSSVYIFRGQAVEDACIYSRNLDPRASASPTESSLNSIFSRTRNVHTCNARRCRRVVAHAGLRGGNTDVGMPRTRLRTWKRGREQDWYRDSRARYWQIIFEREPRRPKTGFLRSYRFLRISGIGARWNRTLWVWRGERLLSTRWGEYGNGKKRKE